MLNLVSLAETVMRITGLVELGCERVCTVRGDQTGKEWCVSPPFQPVRRMTWTPESVNTGPLMSPTFSAKEASSKGFCI